METSVRLPVPATVLLSSISLDDVKLRDYCDSAFQDSSRCLSSRQRAELEDLRRQLEENSSLAGRALRVELDKTREEQERRHQVNQRRVTSAL